MTAAALAVPFMLAACGGAASDDAADTTAEASGTQVVVDHLDREVEIPQEPQRVVFLHEEHAAHVTSVGYVPAGITWAYGENFVERLETIGGESSADLDGVVDLGSAEELNVEAIAALGPDLIIGWDDPETVDQVSPVAPYLAINARENPSGEAFETQRFLADVVGVGDAVETQIDEYEAALYAFRTDHAEALDGLEYTYLDVGFDGLAYMYNLPTFAVNAVMADIGADMSAAMRTATDQHLGYDEPNGYAEVSVEVLTEYDADIVFLGTYEDDITVDDELAILGTTTAGQNDQIFRVDANRWTFHLLKSQIDILGELDAIFDAQQIDPTGDFA